MIFYKYYLPTTNSFKSIINAGLWCDKYTNMNDPFECLATVPRTYNNEQVLDFKERALKSGIPTYIQLASLRDDVIIEFMNSVRNDLIENSYFFASLSETYDNILLWSHYALSNTGFVLAIDLNETNNHVQKVTYQDNLPDFDMDWYFRVKNDDDTNSAEIAYLLKDFAIKSNHWNYEKEWRVCRKDKGYFRFLPEQVKAVYFGLNCDFDIEKVVMTLLSYPDEDVPIYKMALSTNPLSMIAKDYEFPS